MIIPMYSLTENLFRFSIYAYIFISMIIAILTSAVDPCSFWNLVGLFLFVYPILLLAALISSNFFTRFTFSKTTILYFSILLIAILLQGNPFCTLVLFTDAALSKRFCDFGQHGVIYQLIHVFLVGLNYLSIIAFCLTKPLLDKRK